MGAYDYLLGAQQVQLPDPIKSAAGLMALAQASSANQLQQYTLQQSQRKDASAKALQQAIPGLDVNDPAAVAAAQQRFPEAALDIAKYASDQQKASAAAGKDKAETARNNADALMKKLDAGGGYALHLSQTLQDPRDAITFVNATLPRLGIDPSIVQAPQDPSDIAGWRQSLNNFASLSVSAKAQIEQSQTADKNTQTANYQQGELQATQRRDANTNAAAVQRNRIAAVQADPWNLNGLQDMVNGGAPQPNQQAAPAGFPQQPQGAAAAPTPQITTLPNGNPGYTPDAMQTFNQKRMQALQDEIAQQQATGKVDPILAKEVAFRQAQMSGQAPQTAFVTPAMTSGTQSPAQPNGAPPPGVQQPDAIPPIDPSALQPGGKMSISDAMSAGLHGDDFLKVLPPALQNAVKRYASGAAAPPTGAAMRSQSVMQLMDLVSQYDPTFDSTNYGARAAMARDWGDQGAIGKSNLAINTVIGHLGDLQKSANALNNFSNTTLNSVVNGFESSQLGDPRYKEFEANAGAVAKELERAYRGTGGSQGDIDAMKGELSSSNSPQQISGVIQKYVDLLQSKIEANADAYTKTMGHAPPPLLSAKAQSTHDTLEAGKQPQQVAANKPQTFNSMPDPASLAGRKIVADDGTTYQSDGSSWKRVQ